MIKNSKGVTLALLVITLIVLAIISGVTVNTSYKLLTDTKTKTIISNMFLVKGKVETIYDEWLFANGTKTLPGLKATADNVSSAFEITFNGSEGEFWYKWDKGVLESQGLEPTMISGASNYFLVNYLTGEVLYSAGVKNSAGKKKYKLSDLVSSKVN